MNKSKLQREGKKWIQEDIITEEQLEAILSQYDRKEPSFIFVTFAVLFISIGVLLLVFSDWAQIPSIARVAMITIFMIILYILGHYFYKRQSTAFGIGFIILGYVFFGATLFLIRFIYDASLLNHWLFIIWGLVGLGIYALYNNRFILSLGMLIVLIGQLNLALSLSEFNWFLFAIFILGYFHFVYHHEHRLTNYFFSIGLSIQLLVLMISEGYHYYWLIVLFLLMYILAELIPKVLLKQALLLISLLSIFILSMVESFLLQQSYFIEGIEYQSVFFIIWALLWMSIIVLKWLRKNHIEMIDLILFIPVFFIPYAYFVVMALMFTFAIYWLIIGYKKQINEKIVIGITSFLMSTFTAYIQFGWETMNRSLFFIVGGLLLFVISFIFERQRRTMDKEEDK